MLNETLDPTKLQIAPIHTMTDPMAEFGAICLITLIAAYFFFLGFLASRHGKLERQLIGRALRTAPVPEDKILLEHYEKLLDQYREKPKS